ncbi:MAG TPA: ribosome silencing factor [Candidatus Sumerlaeota bacterium]|nr:ribosome silencing factor [Candidatus Sumerlaeota bacterium]
MISKARALEIARIASEKKAEDILVLNVGSVCNFTDFFVIVTGQSSTHLRGICHEVERIMKEKGVRVHAIDGATSPSWQVMDFGDVVLHCFTEETRRFFNLERLWGDAKTMEWQAG